MGMTKTKDEVRNREWDRRQKALCERLANHEGSRLRFHREDLKGEARKSVHSTLRCDSTLFRGYNKSLKYLFDLTAAALRTASLPLFILHHRHQQGEPLSALLANVFVCRHNKSSAPQLGTETIITEKL